MDNLEERAIKIMQTYNTGLVEKFSKIVMFAHDNPNFAAVFRGKNPPAFGTDEYLHKLAQKYIKGLAVKSLPETKTVPDPALSVVMEHGYGVKTDEIDIQIEGHRRAMVAENVVGDLLERYIDSELDDWVWAAGEVIKHIDFIRPNGEDGTLWESLQIKNRDNSENSSSSAIRKGTEIKKWYRTVSRTGQTRWEEFPVGAKDIELSEQGFQKFIIESLST